MENITLKLLGKILTWLIKYPKNSYEEMQRFIQFAQKTGEYLFYHLHFVIRFVVSPKNRTFCLVQESALHAFSKFIGLLGYLCRFSSNCCVSNTNTIILCCHDDAFGYK